MTDHCGFLLLQYRPCYSKALQTLHFKLLNSPREVAELIHLLKTSCTLDLRGAFLTPSLSAKLFNPCMKQLLSLGLPHMCNDIPAWFDSLGSCSS